MRDFSKNAFDRIDAVRERGGVVLLVSHSMEQIAHHCDRAILLEGGAVAFAGKPPEAIHRYLALVSGKAEAKRATARNVPWILPLDDKLVHRPNYNPAETRWGDRAVHHP
jgi:lipopolysaccharide transport system ATP-binding protein